MTYFICLIAKSETFLKNITIKKTLENVITNHGGKVSTIKYLSDKEALEITFDISTVENLKKSINNIIPPNFDYAILPTDCRKKRLYWQTWNQLLFKMNVLMK